MKVRITDTAKRRILEISQYLEASAPEHKEHVISIIHKRIMSLSNFPDRGVVVRALSNSKIREVYALSYRISYLIESDTVYVLTIEHMRQQRHD